MNRVAIIQARVASTRLPGKVLKQIDGKEILGHVIGRLAACRMVDRIVIATTTGAGDDEIVDYLTSRHPGIGLFRGSEDDVLDRYYQAAKRFEAGWVIRATSDSPLLDPELVDFVIATVVEGGYDYGSNSLVPSMPDGLDVECMTSAALAAAWQEAVRPEEREHVTPYIRTNPQRFRLANIAYHRDLSHLCWALDTEEDLAFLTALAGQIDLGDPGNYSFETVLRVIEAHPEVSRLNACSVRDVKLLAEIPQIFNAAREGVDTIPYQRGGRP